jgi:IclR family acetate operon transcriptional repressor
MVSDNGTGVQTVDRALEALSLIVTEGRLLSLEDVTARLGISKSAAYRLLRSLEAADFIARDRTAGGYGVASRFLSLSVIAASRIDVRRAARPAMERIVTRFGETASLHVRSSDRRVCVEVVEGTHPVRRVIPIGENHPLYAGETGRALLSGLVETELTETLRAAVAAGLDERQVRDDLVRIRGAGFFIGIGVRTPGVGSISLPIQGAMGIAGALTVSGPANRWSAAAMRRAAPALLAEAQGISQAIGASIEPASDATSA